VRPSDLKKSLFTGLFMVKATAHMRREQPHLRGPGAYIASQHLHQFCLQWHILAIICTTITSTRTSF